MQDELKKVNPNRPLLMIIPAKVIVNRNLLNYLFIVVLENKDMIDGISEEALNFNEDGERSAIYDFLYPSKELLPDDKEMSIFDHLEELRERIFISVLGVGGSILGCFAFSKDLVKILEAPVKSEGVRFLQLAPGEFFFTTLKVTFFLAYISRAVLSFFSI